MRTFILEDDSRRMDGFNQVLGYDLTVAKDVRRAKKLFRRGEPFDLILLDHDLGESDYKDPSRESNNGTEFAKWLASSRTPQGEVIIHSYNPDGAMRMYHTLSPAHWKVTCLPFGPALLKYLGNLHG